MYHLSERLARAGRQLVRGPASATPSEATQDAASQADWTPLAATDVGPVDWSTCLGLAASAQRAPARRQLDAAALQHLLRRPEQRVDICAFIDHGV